MKLISLLVLYLALPVAAPLCSHASPPPPSPVSAGDSLTFQAVLTPAVSITLFAHHAGIVAQVRAQPGQRVAPGDTLATLEPGLIRLRRDLAYLHHDELRTRLNRLSALATRGLVSAYEMEQFQHRTALAELAYRRADYDLSRTVLTAPRAGLVAQVHVTPGAHVSAGQACVLVVDPTHLQAELPIPMDRLGRVHLGLAVRARHDNAPPLQGHLVQLAPVIDPDTGCCLALARFSAGGQPTRPGTVARITIGPTSP